MGKQVCSIAVGGRWNSWDSASVIGDPSVLDTTHSHADRRFACRSGGGSRHAAGHGRWTDLAGGVSTSGVHPRSHCPHADDQRVFRTLRSLWWLQRTQEVRYHLWYPGRRGGRRAGGAGLSAHRRESPFPVLGKLALGCQPPGHAGDRRPDVADLGWHGDFPLPRVAHQLPWPTSNPGPAGQYRWPAGDLCRVRPHPHPGLPVHRPTGSPGRRT